MLFINYAAAPHLNPRDRGRYFFLLAIQDEPAGVAPRTALQRALFHALGLFLSRLAMGRLMISESGGCEANFGASEIHRTLYLT